MTPQAPQNQLDLFPEELDAIPSPDLRPEPPPDGPFARPTAPPDPAVRPFEHLSPAEFRFPAPPPRPAIARAEAKLASEALLSPETPESDLQAALDTPASGTLSSLKHIHEAIIDAMIENPLLTHSELARFFGYTKGYLSRIIASDVFQDRLQARRDAIVNPEVAATLHTRLAGLAAQSADILMDRLEVLNDPKLALKTLETSTRALGYGVRPATQVEVQQSFVVALPDKAADTSAWLEGSSRRIVSLPAEEEST